MTDTKEDLTLAQDVDFAKALRRVAYEAGMMLGLEATRDEQAYHRRRLTRHQYWMDGYGTLAGMAVSMSPASHPNATDTVKVQLRVSPGLGIDGLGREVMIDETYCINLGEWVAAQSQSHLSEGFIEADHLLWLKVCVRQMDCAVAKQPVLARKLNLSTDAVQPSRTADSVQLELIPELPPDAETRFYPWFRHNPVENTMPALTSDEQATLAAVAGVDALQLSLHARLLHALDSSGLGIPQISEPPEDNARLLLARIRIDCTSVDTIVVNPQNIHINNLVRPFLFTASQLAWLARQP